MQARSLRRELESRRKLIRGKIQSSMESTRGQEHGREIFKDPYGNAALTLDDEINAAVVERRVQMLAELNSALDEIEEGRYGICRDCAAEISKARLQVMPFATRCVPCQSAYEAIQRKAA